jgi:hypothetical protein
MLRDLLKPATIVDGQHRTEGAAFLEQKIPFAVVGLIDADWCEEVFQFVVINQKARAIKTEFLSAIISSSLSAEDISELNARLEQAGIELENKNIIELVDTSIDSPFKGMIDFKIKHATGQLKFSGMLSLAKKFRGLSTSLDSIRSKDFFRMVFNKVSTGTKYSEKRKSWNDGEWFIYFCAFWATVKTHFDKQKYDFLWNYNTNLMKIVSLQELQNSFLIWLNNQRTEISSKTELEDLTRRYIHNLNGSFFREKWQQVSLQSTPGRKILREALENALNSLSYKNDDKLFNE